LSDSVWCANSHQVSILNFRIVPKASLFFSFPLCITEHRLPNRRSGSSFPEFELLPFFLFFSPSCCCWEPCRGLRLLRERRELALFPYNLFCFFLPFSFFFLSGNRVRTGRATFYRFPLLSPFALTRPLSFSIGINFLFPLLETTERRCLPWSSFSSRRNSGGYFEDVEIEGIQIFSSSPLLSQFVLWIRENRTFSREIADPLRMRGRTTPPSPFTDLLSMFTTGGNRLRSSCDR